MEWPGICWCVELLSDVGEPVYQLLMAFCNSVLRIDLLLEGNGWAEAVCVCDSRTLGRDNSEALRNCRGS